MGMPIASHFLFISTIQPPFLSFVCRHQISRPNPNQPVSNQSSHFSDLYTFLQINFGNMGRRQGAKDYA
jgi:hypothetical protein